VRAGARGGRAHHAPVGRDHRGGEHRWRRGPICDGAPLVADAAVADRSCADALCPVPICARIGRACSISARARKTESAAKRCNRC
jgi:hypothetical protein